MPEAVTQGETVATFLRLGFDLLVEEGGFVMFSDPAYPARPVKLDFSRGVIPWEDFRSQLEYEGVNVAVFLAELESM